MHHHLAPALNMNCTCEHWPAVDSIWCDWGCGLQKVCYGVPQIPGDCCSHKYSCSSSLSWEWGQINGIYTLTAVEFVRMPQAMCLWLLYCNITWICGSKSLAALAEVPISCLLTHLVNLLYHRTTIKVTISGRDHDMHTWVVVPAYCEPSIVCVKGATAYAVLSQSHGNGKVWIHYSKPSFAMLFHHSMPTCTDFKARSPEAYNVHHQQEYNMSGTGTDW
jgi:hypothetical protein